MYFKNFQNTPSKQLISPYARLYFPVILKRLAFVIIFIGLIWFLIFKNDSVVLGPGVFAPDPPQQINLGKRKSFRHQDFFITPLAKFRVKAKVLSRKNYRWGKEAKISPVDLALGWGRMSDENVLKSIKISQRNRWYFWRTKHFPIPRREIETCSANMHLIPANEEIEEKINHCRKGEIVEFEGYLVRVNSLDNWHWVSSLSRKDIGGHACELVYVEKFKILNYP